MMMIDLEVKKQLIKNDVIKKMADEQFGKVDSIFYDAGEVEVGGKRKKINLKGIDQKLVEETALQKAEELSKRLMVLCDSKQKDAEKFVMGYKGTQKQIERYKDKYERAMQGEFNDDLNSTIIQKFEHMRAEIRFFTDMIEECRGFADDLIQAGEIDKAEKLIQLAGGFDKNTTMAEVRATINGVVNG